MSTPAAWSTTASKAPGCGRPAPPSRSSTGTSGPSATGSSLRCSWGWGLNGTSRTIADKCSHYFHCPRVKRQPAERRTSCPWAWHNHSHLRSPPVSQRRRTASRGVASDHHANPHTQASATAAVQLPHLLTPPGVYAPQSNTEMLTQALSSEALGPTTRLPNLGTGSGSPAVQAVRLGARVSAVDIPMRSVWAARLNARLSRQHVTVHHDDVTATLRGHSYEIIVSNPPMCPPPRPICRLTAGALVGRGATDRQSWIVCAAPSPQPCGPAESCCSCCRGCAKRLRH
ncbi:methyltransferase [Streptomyces sp. NPDC055134]